MIKYKNISCSTKTFYGITFNPGDVKEVPGYVNANGMARIVGIKETKLTPVTTKRGRPSKKSVTEEDKLPDLTSTTTKQSNILEEDTPNG